jgi:hypothetical protein
MGVGDALERLARRLKISLLKCVLADGSQGSGMDRVDFQNAGPELEGVGVASRLLGLRGLGFECVDLFGIFPCILHRLDSSVVNAAACRPAGGMMAPGGLIRNRCGSVRFALAAGHATTHATAFRARRLAITKDISRGARCS